MWYWFQNLYNKKTEYIEKQSSFFRLFEKEKKVFPKMSHKSKSH